MNLVHDIAVVGGGIMGCAAALHLTEAGMQVSVLEKGDLCQGASGVNAGTLSLQIKRVSLMEYARRGHEIWQQMGDAVGFRKTGGFTLAFNDREAELLLERQTLKRNAGAPITFVTPEELAKREPQISRSVAIASYCSEDGYANSSLTGSYYRKRLRMASIAYREHCPVTEIDRSEGVFVLSTPFGQVRARRILLAAGAWLGPVAEMLDVRLPVQARINTVAVTEAMPPIFRAVVGHATGLLTMKQKPNGTVLIGGGWQGAGTPQDGRGRVVGETLVPNIALARFAVPNLAHARILRSWTGFEAHVPDFYPLAGSLPGIDGAFTLGCVRGGYTIGPYIARLVADQILGRDPELPLFDPGRSFEGAS